MSTAKLALQMLRTSERTSFKRCAWKWWHEYVIGLRQVDPRPTAADFGSGIHLCLAEWYIPGKKRGRHPVETWLEWMKDQHGKFVRVDDPDSTEEENVTKFEDARELGEEMLTCYVDKWGKDRSWEIIAPEQRFALRIPHPKISGRSIVMYVGTMDGVFRDHNDGKIKILETKSTNKNLEKFLVETQFTEQFGGYDSVATKVLRKQGLIGPKEVVSGMTYNMLRRAKQDTRPVGPDGRRHNQPNKENYAKALEGQTINGVEWYADELMKLPITSKVDGKDTLATLAEKSGTVVLGDVSAKQPTPWFMRETFTRAGAERARQITRIGEEALHMRAIRRGQLPILKNPTMDCSWQCQFFQLCQLDESGDDTEFYRDSVYEKVDPYADHQGGADNSKVSLLNRRKTGVS